VKTCWTDWHTFKVRGERVVLRGGEVNKGLGVEMKRGVKRGEWRRLQKRNGDRGGRRGACIVDA
jgi:hypothetical protein